MFPVAILAGGLATRMRPATEKVPKAMLAVGGKPFIDHQLLLLKKHGFQKVVVCAGYLGEIVQRHVGNGDAYGMDVRWSFDGDRLLGTGGALCKALSQLGDAFFVLYGDSYLQCPYGAIQKAFEESGASGLMTVFRNNDRFDRSNVEFSNGRIVEYNKRSPSARMEHIDYGLGILRASVFNAIRKDAAVDLADMYADLVRQGQLAGYEVQERFYEIGSFEGLHALDTMLKAEQESAAK